LTIDERPEQFLQKLVKVICHGREREAKEAGSLRDFFTRVTDAQMEEYTSTVVSVVLNNEELYAKVKS
jgi:hypothetical protein